MRLDTRSIDDAFDFLNGKPVQLDEYGEFDVFGSNGKIGLSKEWNHENAIILGRVGAYCGSVMLCDGRFWATDNTIVLKAKGSQSLRYWFYRLQNFPIRSFAGGAAQPLMTHGILRGIDISVHGDTDVQARIADILATYDDLIENNRRRMTLLEESARLLYREWFVRLRFPGHEHTRVVDGAPRGWACRLLKDICIEVRETVSPESMEPDTPYIGLEHIPRRSISLGEWGSVEQVTSSKHRFGSGDILFGKIRPYFHKVGVAFIDGVASSDAIVIRPIDELMHGFVLMTVSSDGFVADTAQSMKEGSKMPRADWKQMQAYPVALPPPGLLSTFEGMIQPILVQLKTLTFTNQKLRTARDLLLPRLMSGDLTV